MFAKLLIANRGEIACRIIRTARAMGIATVAVYSDADAKALHVRQADEAVHIGPSPAAESYLRGDKIIAAALATGAEAVHPGYGFLSENAAFARAVTAAGLVWVGPSPESIEAMGLKDAAKALMRAAGVPVTPGYDGADQAPAHLLAEAEAIGFPVLVKAVAGGGGKGMRKVDASGDFLAALESCQREAQASFGNAHVLLEKWITSPRHIEVQVFGDNHGNVVHLFERDCSLQRRHQKVIEEAPAPGMDEATRTAICGAAVRAAAAVDYSGAGTIEFIADASEGLRADRIFFMEMNTRLQVEHPVTEEITGVDLVEWQLRVAAEEPLPLRQDELSISGHAIEARLYAEDPARGFLPSTGRLERLAFGDTFGRIETGVEENDEVSPFYDPMIAKLVVHAPTRAEAVDAFKYGCGNVECAPVRTNAWFLKRLLGEADFVAGKVTTGFIGDNLEHLTAPPILSNEVLQVVADAIATAPPCLNDPAGSPAFRMREGLQGFRLNADQCRTVRLQVNDVPTAVLQTLSRDRLLEIGWDRPTMLSDPSGEIMVFEGGEAFKISLNRTEADDRLSAHDGDVISPMPGKVIAVDVAEGQLVEAGQRLMVLEAMKMEHALTAPFAGVVSELSATVGGQVQVDALLARVVPAD